MRAAVHLEALRLARIDVRASIINAGLKLSQFTAVDISKAAKTLVEADPLYAKEAERNLKQARELGGLS